MVPRGTLLLYESNEHRYELMQRVKLWRFISNQLHYDIGERFLRRIEHNPQLAAVFGCTNSQKRRALDVLVL